MKKTCRADAGHSLIDLVVATAAMGLVMAGLLAILRSGTTTYRWGAARVEAQQSARAALERMATELRGAGYEVVRLKDIARRVRATMISRHDVPAACATPSFRRAPLLHSGLSDVAPRYDVVVIGAGAAGMSAALFASIRGAKTLLVEKTGFVGGT